MDDRLLQIGNRRAYLDVLLSLFPGERAASPQQVNESNTDGTVDVQDEVVLFAGGDLLNLDCVLQDVGVGEVVQDEVLHNADT